MDATDLARELLDGLPANATLGLTVRSAVDGTGVVALPVARAVTNVVGSLHSSGIAALVDAAGLAALLSVLPDEATARRLQPLGTTASFQFLQPVRGTGVATCTVGAPLQVDRLTWATPVTTQVLVAGDGEPEAATGSFTWTVRLAPAG